jgi:hypothetical protein
MHAAHCIGLHSPTLTGALRTTVFLGQDKLERAPMLTLPRILLCSNRESCSCAQTTARTAAAHRAARTTSNGIFQAVHCIPCTCRRGLTCALAAQVKTALRLPRCGSPSAKIQAQESETYAGNPAPTWSC